VSDSASIRIRPPRPGDEAAIGALSHRASTTDAPPWATIHSLDAETAWARSVIDAPNPATSVLVAADNGDRVLGFVAVVPVTDLSGHRHGHIGSIAVAPEAEGRGIGRLLLSAAEDWCREQGFTDVTLHVYPGNERARQVYERAGFQLEWHRLRKDLRSPAPNRRAPQEDE
jgi:ribosomal protein S18 acetylase RimI-like enzyme